MLSYAREYSFVRKHDYCRIFAGIYGAGQILSARPCGVADDFIFCRYTDPGSDM